MENFVCVQCGTQFAETSAPPPSCPICEDERQFVRHTGQEWTTLKRLKADHHNRLEEEAPRLLGIGTAPEFAIGQRALLSWTIRPLPKSTRAAASAPLQSRIHTFTRQWLIGPSALMRKYFCTLLIVSGSCLPRPRDRAFSFGKEQRFRFGMA